MGAVALVAIGWLLRASDEPAIGRLASVLWFLASCGVLWAGWVLAYDALETSDRVAGITSGGSAVAVSAVLYLLRRRSLQQVALAGAITYTVGFAFFEPTPNGIAWWTLGVVWFFLGKADVLPPQRVALAIGPW